MRRRQFLTGFSAAAVLQAVGCRDATRYTDADVRALATQRETEAARSGKGPFGLQRYQGYRGLADLPYFELDPGGRLRCVVEDLPPILDIHAHLGISLLFAPAPDLLARSERVEHILDCDAESPGCPLDLDVYINANFRPKDLRALRWGGLTQLVTVPHSSATHTIPNLLAEMDDLRVDQAMVLPIAFGLPFGDDLSERFIAAIDRAGASKRLFKGASVHHTDPDAVSKLERYAAAGARMVKLHPPMARFYPDSDEMDPIYRACDRLGLPVLFHGGRAGIEPEAIHPYALMRHYEGAFRRFPDLQFVLGHAGARDVEDAIAFADRHPNVWYDIHGQGVTTLGRMLETLGPERLLFGSDWPFYHLAATLAKVLLVTEQDPLARRGILRGNAARLLGLG